MMSPVGGAGEMDDMNKVAIIMGSDSDLKVMQGAMDTLKALEIPFCVRILSAHRTPDAAAQFAKGAKDEGYGAIIAAAGKAAHLAGAMAANTILPVIGVPMKSSTLDGLDALLSTVQMPSGMPVATVAIDGAVNAALLAAQILALSDEALARRFVEYRAAQSARVADKDARISAEYSCL
jgi:5-(carboxyamino)imidazole ribonucleotide mutase